MVASPFAPFNPDGSPYVRPARAADAFLPPQTGTRSAGTIPGVSSVPVTDPRNKMLGTAAGGMQQGQGYGVANGVPLGSTDRDRQQKLADRYKFAPGNLARLRAATAAQLGRRA